MDEQVEQTVGHIDDMLNCLFIIIGQEVELLFFFNRFEYKIRRVQLFTASRLINCLILLLFGTKIHIYVENDI